MFPPPPPPPPPTSFPLISTSLDARSLNPELHCPSRLPLCHHPPHSMHISNALTSGITTYSVTSPSTQICSVFQKHSKTIPRSLLHLMDLSLLLSEPMDGSAPYLMASILPQTLDLFSAICHHPSVLKCMGSSPISDSYTTLANTLTPACPSKPASTLTPPV